MSTTNGTRISIIVPLYNRDRLIKETIASVARQSYENWELLIVDDGSTDGSLDVVVERASRDPRIRGWRRSAAVKGAPACRNEGLSRASGEFAVFLDSDDLLAERCLENRLRVFKQHPDHDFHVFPTSFFSSAPGDRSGVWFCLSKDYLLEFTRGAPWCITAPIWKVESLRRLGGFREDLLSWQDWDLHIRAIIDGFQFTVNDGQADNFVRRSAHHRISIDSERDRAHLDNRMDLFLTTFQSIESHALANDSIRSAFVDQSVRLAAKLQRAGMKSEVDRWLQQLIEHQLIDESQISTIQSEIKRQSRVSLRERVSIIKQDIQCRFNGIRTPLR